MKKHWRYLKYVMRHKYYVFRAGCRTEAPCWRLIIHDWSKFSLAEWGPYVRSFYGPQPRTDKVKADFDHAWLHHQHCNAHHWQHWVLREDSGKVKTLPMPIKFVREMVADWMGAGRAITGRWDYQEWYANKRDHIDLHPDTRVAVEAILNRVSPPN